HPSGTRRRRARDTENGQPETAEEDPQQQPHHDRDVRGDQTGHGHALAFLAVLLDPGHREVAADGARDAGEAARHQADDAQHQRGHRHAVGGAPRLTVPAGRLLAVVTAAGRQLTVGVVAARGLLPVAPTAALLAVTRLTVATAARRLTISSAARGLLAVASAAGRLLTVTAAGRRLLTVARLAVASATRRLLAVAPAGWLGAVPALVPIAHVSAP